MSTHAPAARAWQERGGFTLVEMLVVVLVFGLIIAGALGYYMSQNRAFAAGSDRTAATQNLLYAATAATRDVATAGTNLGSGQPFLIYAGADVVAFNADYVSAVADPFAVYHDPDAPSGSLMAATVDQQFRIPNTSVVYPDTTFPGVGTPLSGAETITIFFSLDATTERVDDYALWRQVNDREPEMIARDLVAVEGEPFFSYMRVLPPSGGVARTGEVPDAALPLRHSVPAHGSPADTGLAAVIDSVRAVRVTLASIAPGDSATNAQVMRLLVWLPNADLDTPRSCGSEPIFGGGLTAQHVVDAGTSTVQLRWNAATDETSGEQDVMRYVIYRRRSGDPQTDEAYQSIPAGNASYVFTDRNVVAGDSWIYQVAAQDCTPSLSTRITAAITIPGTP